MEYDNTNRGVLFKNDKKESDKHPDYKGSYTDGSGSEHWLSAWIKMDKNGKPFMSLSTTPKDQAHKAGMKQVQEVVKEFVSDDIPF